MQKFHLKLVAAAAGLCFAGGASATIIDLFDDPAPPNIQQVLDTTAGATPVSDEYAGVAVPSTILGGYRDLIVNKVSGSTAGVSKLNVADGALNFSNDAGANPVVGKALVQWDGQDDPASTDKGINAHNLNANLIIQEGCPASGCSIFEAQILFADRAFDYSFTVYSGAANFSKLTALSQFEIDASNTEIADYEFAWFGLAATTGTVNTLLNVPLNLQGRCTTNGLTNGLGGNYYCLDGLAFLIEQGGTKANFAKVSALELGLNNVVGKAALDLTLGAFTKTGVPEPGTLALVGASLLGLAGIRRRRQA